MRDVRFGVIDGGNGERVHVPRRVVGHVVRRAAGEYRDARRAFVALGAGRTLGTFVTLGTCGTLRTGGALRPLLAFGALRSCRACGTLRTGRPLRPLLALGALRPITHINSFEDLFVQPRFYPDTALLAILARAFGKCVHEGARTIRTGRTGLSLYALSAGLALGTLRTGGTCCACLALETGRTLRTLWTGLTLITLLTLIPFSPCGPGISLRPLRPPLTFRTRSAGFTLRAFRAVAYICGIGDRIALAGFDLYPAFLAILAGRLRGGVYESAKTVLPCRALLTLHTLLAGLPVNAGNARRPLLALWTG